VYEFYYEGYKRMIYINEAKINDLLDSERSASFEKINAVAKKAENLERFTKKEILINSYSKS